MLKANWQLENNMLIIKLNCTSWLMPARDKKMSIKGIHDVLPKESADLRHVDLL